MPSYLGETEIFDRNNGKVLVVLTAAGVAITDQVASCNLELIEENTGSSWKLGVVLRKGKSDGSYVLEVSSIASKMILGNTYSYFISSGATTVDSVFGRIKIAERAKISDIINMSERLYAAIQQLISDNKKEKENASKLLAENRKQY